MSDFKNKIVLTGIKPTGRLHLGNYVGAMVPTLELGGKALDDGGTLVMFIADYHAINAMKDPVALKEAIKNLACAYLASGLDANRAIFYRQSDVPEITELTTILMAYTPKGFMNKAHAYKAQVDKNVAKGEPADAGINMGLYTYPVLMAADILGYGTDVVPVGKDQVQHVEMAQDIAGFINYHFQKEVLKVPEYYLKPNAAVLPGLDGRKMSKSYDNVIPLFGTPDEVKKAVMGIKTDSQAIDAPKNPDEILLFQILQGVGRPATVQEVKEGLEKGGMGYGTIKKMLLAELEEVLPSREKYLDYQNHFSDVEDLLRQGAEKARKLARPVLERVKDAVFGRG